jgi:predicted metal-dependent peptidase
MKTPPPDPRIERARYSLILDAPFWGALMVRLPVFPGYERPTFCTDGKRIRYNQAYADTLTDGEIRYALCHEIAHCAFLHMFRIEGRDLELWNRACDYVVNQMLDDYAADCVQQGREVPWTRPKEWLDIDKHPQFRGLSAEEIYREMVGNPPPPQQSQDGSGGGQGQPQPGQQPGQGQPDPNAQPQPQQGQPGPGDFEAPPPDEPQEGQEPGAESGLEGDWSIAVAQAEQIAKMKGNCPGAASNLANALRNPKVDWRDVLREFVQAKAKTDWSFARPNRRHLHRGFLLPTLNNLKVGRIVFAFDSSGSTVRYADDYATEIQAALDSVQPERIDVIVCDARVQHVQSFEPGEKVTIDAKGGGGTDFRPVFDVIDDPKKAEENGLEMDDPPICVVYLTDLDGSFPRTAPEYPVLWIAVDARHRKAPWGEVIHV